MPNKGDIVVRLYTVHTNNTIFMREHQIGKMYQIIESHGHAAKYKFKYSMPKGYYRMATKQEIQAFNNGITNINDIPKQDNYTIY